MELTDEQLMKIDALVQTVLPPLLRRFGATIKERNYTEFYKAIVLEYNDKDLVIGLGIINRGETGFRGSVEFLIENIDGMEEVVHHFVKEYRAPFHSDIYSAVKARWPYSKYDDMAYSYICNGLRVAGIRIWS